MNKIQILYPGDETNKIKSYYINEANCFKKIGFLTNNSILKDAECVLYRGHTIFTQKNYPSHPKMIQDWDANRKTLYINEFYDIIKKHTMPTIFIDSLSDEKIKGICLEHDWKKVFIKSLSTSLFAIGDNTSVWPDTTINEMTSHYKRMGITGPFAVRKFIDNPEIFYNEQRYWVLNGLVYHPSGIVPNFVQENAKKIFEFSGSHYFTIDVAGKYIVEVNPGESSDRGGDNPLDWFCEIFAKAFLCS